MSVAPDDSVWRGRTFDAGLVLHRETGSSRDCSAAWAADVVQRVSREGAAASDATSLAHVEGGGLQLSWWCARPEITSHMPTLAAAACIW